MCRSSAFVALRSIHFCLPLTAVLGSRKILNCYTCSALSYYAMVICTIGLALGDFSWQLWFLVWSYSLRAVLQPPCCVCCMRHKLRRQLNIKGTCLEDTWIHCGMFRCAEGTSPLAFSQTVVLRAVAHPCALAQEAREVQRRKAVLPAQPVAPPSGAALQESLLAS